MRWVDQATVRPFRCALIPYVGNGGGHSFIDTGQDLDLEHVYISDSAAELVARMAGWAPAQEYAALQRECVRLEGRVAELEAELAEADEFKSHIDGLKTHGFMVARAPGRPKKKQKEEVAGG